MRYIKGKIRGVSEIYIYPYKYIYIYIYIYRYRYRYRYIKGKISGVSEMCLECAREGWMLYIFLQYMYL